MATYNFNSSIPEDYTDLAPFLAKSESFAKCSPFPVTENLTVNLQQRGYDPDILLRNVNESYPLVHEEMLPLMADFIQLKKDSGSKIEKQVYQDMDVVKLIDRLTLFDLIKHSRLHIVEIVFSDYWSNDL